MYDVVRFGKCLTDPESIRVLAMLREGELCICELQAVLGMTRASVNRRLDRLRMAGLVHTRRRGRWLTFDLNEGYVDLVETLFECFDSVAWDPKIVEDDRVLRQELKKRVDGWCSSDAPISPETAKANREDKDKKSLSDFFYTGVRICCA